MINYNSMIDSTDGTYCVLFKNVHALIKKEVEEIFEQFGYKCEDDAKNAIDNLKDHPKVKLLEHINLKQENNSNNIGENENNDEERQQCDGIKFIQNFVSQACKKIDKSIYDRNIINVKVNEYSSNFNNDLSLAPKSSNETQKENNFSLIQKSPNTSVKSNNLQLLLNRIQEQKYANSYKKNCDELPDLIESNEKIQNQEIEMNDLMMPDGRSLPIISPINRIILAQEVIVANIHPRFGASYILNLFEHFKPIAITNVMVMPRTGNRYCHVYFESAKESEQVEIMFDNVPLLDQKLIVIGSNRLVKSTPHKSSQLQTQATNVISRDNSVNL